MLFRPYGLIVIGTFLASVLSELLRQLSRCRVSRTVVRIEPTWTKLPRISSQSLCQKGFVIGELLRQLSRCGNELEYNVIDHMSRTASKC